jgi:biotin carboxyl carrier protein
MRYTVRIGSRQFHVDIADLKARPVIALVEGETFEVWPENGSAAPVPSGPQPPAATPASSLQHTPSPSAGSASTVTSEQCVLAPIPGVIAAVLVAPGARVEAGQELCVLEAMKMRSPIRAPRAGTIAVVRVSAGQQVRHREVLAEYATDV